MGVSLNRGDIVFLFQVFSVSLALASAAPSFYGLVFFINYIIMICTIKLFTTTTIKYTININTIIATNPMIIIICAIDIIRTTCMVNV